MANPFIIGNSSNVWNYSDDTKENYSEQLCGTVVEIAYVQARNFQTKEPEFWPDGNPKCNFRFTILDMAGNEFSWFVSSNKKSAGLMAVMDALDPARTGNSPVDISKALGKLVTISTKPGSYNAKRPRPWWFQVMGDGDQSKVRGVVDEVNVAKREQPLDLDAQGAYAAAAAAMLQERREERQQAPAPMPAQAPVSNVGPYSEEEIPF